MNEQDFIESLFEKEREKAYSFSKENKIPIYDSPSNVNTNFPGILQIGLTNLCNESCTQCFHPQFSKALKPEHMNEDVQKRIYESLNQFPENVILRYLTMGETLLHPNWKEIFTKIRNNWKGLISIISNGILLTEENIEILKKTVDVIDISLDAYSVETYKKLRNCHRYTDIVKNLELILSQKDRPAVMVSFLIQPENVHELEEFSHYWVKKVDKVIFRVYHTYAGNIINKNVYSNHPERKPCAALWTRMNVNHRGHVSLCYLDWLEKHIIGDLTSNKSSLLDIWRKEYIETRNQQLKGNYKGICEKCNGWRAAHWDLPYELAIKMALNKRGIN